MKIEEEIEELKNQISWAEEDLTELKEKLQNLIE